MTKNCISLLTTGCVVFPSRNFGDGVESSTSKKMISSQRLSLFERYLPLGVFFEFSFNKQTIKMPNLSRRVKFVEHPDPTLMPIATAPPLIVDEAPRQQPKIAAHLSDAEVFIEACGGKEAYISLIREFYRDL